MPDPTTAFFAMLRQHGMEILPEKFQLGSLRFDLVRGMETDHWFVQIEDGRVVVAREERPADCVAHTDAYQFDRLVCGRAHLIAMLMRNEMTVEGVLPLLLLFRRAFPSSPETRDPRELATGRARR